jgi:signal transduction histidine kinase
MLHEFLESRRDEIIGRTKRKVAARPAPQATEAELSLGIPLFFNQLIEALKGTTVPLDSAMDAGATKLGDDMLRQGFTVGQVVHGYGDICQAVTELAFELGDEIPVDEFRMLNWCLDDAIAKAVTEYGRLRELNVTDESTERLGTLAHELRNHLNTAMLSFAILQDGTVSISGSTGAVLKRSLIGLTDLVDKALAEVRLESTVHRRERIVVAELVEELEIVAILQAKTGNHQLTVGMVDFEIVVEADRQLLIAAISNLLQNAFKFTPAGGHVQLRATASAAAILIDVHDECGGLEPGAVQTLFKPFQQHSSNRSGLGMGLSISRKAIRLAGGDIRVRDLPGEGCIFTIELPRAGGPSPATP